MKTYLPNLYALRFFLSMVVVNAHIPLVSKRLDFPFFNDAAIYFKGYLAVYYFFTLSGFLIIRLVYHELKTTGSFNFKKFYLRRIQRLYPVYYLVFLIGILAYHLVLPALDVAFKTDYPIGELIVSYVFLAPNVFNTFYPEVGGILGVLWSIGVEEQFYLVVPLIMFLGRKWLMWTLLATLGILLIVLLRLPEFYMFRNFYFYFLAGGLMAIVAEKWRFKLFTYTWFHLLVFACFVASFVMNRFSAHFNIFDHGIQLLVSSLFITLISYYPKISLSNPFLNYLGKISYGIYMYHMIVITGFLYAFQAMGLQEALPSGLFPVLLTALVFGMTILVASLSYQHFEKRFYTPRTFDQKNKPKVAAQD